VVCVLLALIALIAGAVVTRFTGAGMLSLSLVIVTMALITLYDFAGKYLVAPGRLTLGLIRFFHATVAAPRLPVLWHPLVLLNHVALVSTLAYAWEAKRPPLTRGHWWGVLGLLGLCDVMCVGLVAWRRYGRIDDTLAEALSIDAWLLLPAIAVLAFVAVGIWIRRTLSPTRRAGQALMLAGLLWLIVYDAAFATAYLSWLAGAVLLMFLPLAYVSVRVMRWWGKVLSLSQTPEFQRVR
jgi:hypothetical protein